MDAIISNYSTTLFVIIVVGYLAVIIVQSVFNKAN